jgi:hypothetical protein
MTKSKSSVSTSNQLQTKKEIFESALKEISDYNSDTVDYMNLQMLLFITQQSISDLKNAKTKRIDSFKDMDINPMSLLILL